MKKTITALLLLLIVCNQMLWADISSSDFSFDTTRFQLDELRLDMSQSEHTPALTLLEESVVSASSPTAYTSYSDRQGTWWSRQMSSAEGVKPYRFMDDMSFVGVPLFFAGMIAKKEKASFRQDYRNANAKLRLVSHFKTEVDNYTQYAPFAAATIMNVAGVKGRSKLVRFAASSAASFAVMAAFVNTIKHTAKEMRPDGSTANSWPSGHTATAFAAATILHKEYGMTVSPWYSVAAYTCATATGAMRVLNNRHWVSDVLSGAGIGIVSGELGYALCDLLFKDKGLNRNDLAYYPDINSDPSFFSVNMGIGLDSQKDFTFVYDNSAGEGDDIRELPLKFRNSTVLGVEGAYFFNKYIGVGGRLKVKTTPVGNFPDIADAMYAGYESYQEMLPGMENNVQSAIFNIESDHLSEFTGSLGAYFNLPLGSRFALGSKLLAGTTKTNSLDIDATYAGKVYRNYKETDEDYEITWNALTIDASNAFAIGTGLALTFAYKSNFSWKAFVDYDVVRKTYKMEYIEDGFYAAALPDEVEPGYKGFAVGSELKRTTNTFTLGGAFVVSF